MNSFSFPTCLQVPVQQHPLPGPGLPEATPVSEHALCCLLGEQASEDPWGEFRVNFPRAMKRSIPGMFWEGLSPCRPDERHAGLWVDSAQRQQCLDSGLHYSHVVREGPGYLRVLAIRLLWSPQHKEGTRLGHTFNPSVGEAEASGSL